MTALGLFAMGRLLPEITTTLHPMPRDFSRRRVLQFTAGALSAMALPEIARAQLALPAPPQSTASDEFSVSVPVSIEVNARPFPSFDPRDRSHPHFASLFIPRG